MRNPAGHPAHDQRAFATAAASTGAKSDKKQPPASVGGGRRSWLVAATAVLGLAAGLLPGAHGVDYDTDPGGPPLPTGMPVTHQLFVDYSGRSYTGSIPTQFGLLTKVEYLLLDSNELTGPVPTQLGLLTKITSSLTLQDNSLTGQLPSELGRLTKITATLLAGTNELTSHLPTEIGLITGLTSRLSLQDNELTSSIPSQLAAMSILEGSLELGSNEMSGTIPTELFKLTALTKLLLGPNEVTSQLPTELGRLTVLRSELTISDTDLTALLPTELAHLTVLTSNFQLTSSEFSGAIPTEYGLLSALSSDFSLLGNELSGTIPTELSMLSVLTAELDLRDNDLASIPTQLAKLTGLTTGLRLSTNLFTGQLPSELFTLTMKSEFEIRSSQLSGPIPSEIGQFATLFSELRLDSNSFTGSVPTEIGMLTAMKSFLFLGSNQLCGDIPTEISALSKSFEGGYKVTTGTDLGTPCCETLPDAHTCVPTSAPTTLAPTSSAQKFMVATVGFKPMTVRERQDVRIKFQYTWWIRTGTKIFLRLPWFTSGDCDNHRGRNIASGGLRLYPEGLFAGAWYEGTVGSQFEKSTLELTALQDFELLEDHEVTVDGSNGLRPNCGVDFNRNNFTIWTDNLFNDTDSDQFVLNMSGRINGTCYTTDSRLSWGDFVDESRFKRFPGAEPTFSMRPAFHMYPGDNVTLVLSGFYIRNTTASNYVQRNLTLFNGRFDRGFYKKATADFYQGAPDSAYQDGQLEQPGYLNSTLVFQIKEYHQAGKWFNVTVAMSNGIRAACGMPANRSHWRFKIQSASNETGTDWRRIERVDGVGNGCPNNCNGRGRCNFCTHTCACYEGFGASTDLAYDVMPRDCSGRTCPTGASWASVPQWQNNVTVNNGHAVVECSGAGACERATGKCKCAPGYGGKACQFKLCPGSSRNKPCSGHGRCFSVTELSMQDQALPLTNWSAEPDVYVEDILGNTYDAWDAHRLTGCVCDSSWPVGLGDGETQQPEWFGPDCSLRHCPTGDDPMTSVDETNCTNATAAGGRGTGKIGNRCHVDCSNRGLCDHSTGLCNCFDGWHGSNCGTRVA